MAHAQPVNYQAVDAGAEYPAVGWGDGIFGCLNDMQVCLWGSFPLGCMQYLYAVRNAQLSTAASPSAVAFIVSAFITAPTLFCRAEN
jgi:hypothetical protein